MIWVSVQVYDRIIPLPGPNRKGASGIVKKQTWSRGGAGEIDSNFHFLLSQKTRKALTFKVLWYMLKAFAG